MTARTARTLTVIPVLVEEPSTPRIALGNPAFVRGGVDVQSRGVAFQEGPIAHGVADDVHLDRVIRKAVEPGEPSDPLVEGAVTAAAICSRCAAVTFWFESHRTQ